MPRDLNIISRFKAEAIGQITGAAAGGLLIVFLARSLSSTKYGLLFFAISVLTVIQLFAKLGIPRSTARYISEYRETNISQVKNTISISFTLIFLSSLVVSVILYFSHRFIANIIREPELSVLLKIGSLYIISRVLTRFVRIVLQGFEENKLSVLVYILDTSSRLILVMGLVLAGYGAIGALIGYIIAGLIAFLIGGGIIYLRFYNPIESSSSMESGLRRRIIEYSVPVMITDFGNIVDRRFDIILVGYFLNPMSVSYYVTARQTTSILNKPIEALSFTLSPSLSSEKAAGNINRVRQIYENSLINVLLFYIPLATGLYLVAQPTIGLIFGQEYFSAVPVLKILCPYLVLISFTRLSNSILDYIGRARVRAIAQGIASALNVCLNIILIPTIGVIGAAVSTVFTQALYTLVVFYVINKEFNLRIRIISLKGFQIVLVSGVMALVVAFLLQSNGGWINVSMAIVAGVAVWLVFSLFLGLLDVNKLKYFINFG